MIGVASPPDANALLDADSSCAKGRVTANSRLKPTVLTLARLWLMIRSRSTSLIMPASAADKMAFTSLLLAAFHLWQKHVPGAWRRDETAPVQCARPSANGRAAQPAQDRGPLGDPTANRVASISAQPYLHIP